MLTAFYTIYVLLFIFTLFWTVRDELGYELGYELWYGVTRDQVYIAAKTIAYIYVVFTLPLARAIFWRVKCSAKREAQRPTATADTLHASSCCHALRHFGEETPALLFLILTVVSVVPVATVAIVVAYVARHPKGGGGVCRILWFWPLTWLRVYIACCLFFPMFAMEVYMVKTVAAMPSTSDEVPATCEEGRPAPANGRCALACSYSP